jgi:hypothetical protein
VVTLSKFKLLLISIIVLLCYNNNSLAQDKTLNANTGSKNVVKKNVTYKTGNNGQCLLTLPSWLLNNIKKAPTKYKLKVYSIISNDFLKSKLSKSTTIKDSVAKYSFSGKINNGVKFFNSNFSVSEKISAIDANSTKKYKMLINTISLTNPNNPNVNVIITMTGEPITGAEIFVELEPDEEP